MSTLKPNLNHTIRQSDIFLLHKKVILGRYLYQKLFLLVHSITICKYNVLSGNIDGVNNLIFKVKSNKFLIQFFSSYGI